MLYKFIIFFLNLLLNEYFSYTYIYYHYHIHIKLSLIIKKKLNYLIGKKIPLKENSYMNLF